MNAPGSKDVELNCKNQLSVHRGLAQEFSQHEPGFFKEMCFKEGVGVGVVKVTADEVKVCVTAALNLPGSCQSLPPSACAKETEWFPMCTQRKSLAQLRS